MTQETAKSKIKNFKNQITEKFNVGEANGFRTYIGKLSPVNVLDMLDDIKRSVTTDEKTVEKLQEQFNRKLKALAEIKEIIKNNTHHCDFGCDNNCEMDGALHSYAVEELNRALAAIGGDDDRG